MKAFIDKIFKAKKQKELLDEITNTEVIEENKEILSKQIEISIKKHVETVQEHTDTKDD
jgi:alpha-tubulin suppressor-like RCC1 family protein